MQSALFEKSVVPPAAQQINNHNNLTGISETDTSMLLFTARLRKKKTTVSEICGAHNKVDRDPRTLLRDLVLCDICMQVQKFWRG
jgi:hypothetical protein